MSDKDKLLSVFRELDILRESLRDYDIKLIELDNLKTRTLALENEVVELNKKNEDLNLKVQQLESNTEQGPQIYEKQHSSFMAKQKSEVDVINDNLGRMEEDVSTQLRMHQGIQKRQVPSDGRVAFTAGVSVPDLVSLGLHHTIIFDNAISNIGNAYHPHSGIFLAPVKGVYVFSVTLMVAPRHSQYLQIVVDGALISDIYAGAKNLDESFSSMKQWVLEVNKSSEVWIRTGTPGQVRGYMHTDFSGFLLYQMD